MLVAVRRVGQFVSSVRRIVVMITVFEKIRKERKHTDYFQDASLILHLETSINVTISL